MSPKTPKRRDELAWPLIAVAVVLALDIATSNSQALPGHNHFEPLDSFFKAVAMVLLAVIAYARPVEFGAQLLERGKLLTGLVWLVVVLSAPLVLLLLVQDLPAQLGLIIAVVCAILANIATRILAPLAAIGSPLRKAEVDPRNRQRRNRSRPAGQQQVGHNLAGQSLAGTAGSDRELQLAGSMRPASRLSLSQALNNAGS